MKKKFLYRELEIKIRGVKYVLEHELISGWMATRIDTGVRKRLDHVSLIAQLRKDRLERIKRNKENKGE